MAKHKSNKMTNKEWETLNMIFLDYVENLDNSDLMAKQLKKLYHKIFLMDGVVRIVEARLYG